jgi:inhibitor of KinA sporulation pathway (predicted exonuclease)
MSPRVVAAGSETGPGAALPPFDSDQARLQDNHNATRTYDSGMDTEPTRHSRFDLSRILVIDLEATCWQGARPPGEGPEVIEIGNAVLHVADLHVEPGPELLVRPERSTVSEFCTELTGITQEIVDERGVTFAEALGVLRESHGDLTRMVWASYGEYDRRKLTEECRHHRIPFPLHDTHINVKRLVALTAGWTHESGMAGAMRRVGLEPTPGSRHHRGSDDAVNIGRLLALVLGGGGGRLLGRPREQ